MAELNEKQQRFCDEYLIDPNATQAAIKAGYSKKTAKEQGSRLLTKVNVKAYLDEKLEELKSNKVADAEEVLRYLSSVMRGESQSEVVVVENIGDFTSEARLLQKAPDEKERLKAAELLGKRYRLFTDKMEVASAIPVVISGADQLED